MPRSSSGALSAVVAPLLFMACSSSAPTTAVPSCGSVSGTLSAQTATGTAAAAPLSYCMEYTYNLPDRFAVAGCVDTKSELVCIQVLVSTPLSSPAASVPTEGWSFGQQASTVSNSSIGQTMKASVDSFFSASVPGNTAWIWVAQWVTSAQDYVVYPGAAGGTITISDASLPQKVGGTGSVHLTAQALPLSGGGTVSFDGTFALEVQAAGSGGTSSSGSSSSGAGSGGGTCDTTSCQTYVAMCNAGGIAPCDCAAACVDQAGISNPSACCSASQGAACVAQLKSDCQTNVTQAMQLASPGVTPICSFTQIPCQ